MKNAGTKSYQPTYKCPACCRRSGKQKIRISTDQQNTRTVIQVEDNGIGISEQISDKIFLPFFTTRNSGSGIGLTLTKSIMEAHNGYINFRKQQQGSVFELWFT